MKALATLRSKKIIVDAGDWANGKIPRSAFPLSHVGPHRLGKAWHWCVFRLSDGSLSYRLLVAFEPGKRQYFAWLGVEFGSDQALVGRVEFHASHDGWHCHWKTGPLVDVPRGSVKAGALRERRHQCGGNPLDLSRSDACGVAFHLFNVVGGSSKELLL